ncbi:response regulator [Paenibacillus aurantius]|uniref:Response regulator n=1 Tax=Paenibacillus aurantius TaxID=2918900 RepID=A0AA96RJS8_9BACL|nr:response regulator [Paenibacillus aurantius]WNQ13604.1 response regulator [Paenibacillus aurantius]
MRKVLIVDDEKWIRRGLIQSIPWDRLELAGEAADGNEAHELALQLKPDLLFLDMRMPGLDGRELLALLQRDLPELLTIVVSGYSDFDYTKEAIRHKAFDYLLKPVKKEELAAVLEKAMAELDRRAADLRRTADRSGGDWLKSLLLGTRDRDGYRPPEWREGDAYAVLLVQPDVFEEQEERGSLAPLLKKQLELARPFLFGGQWSCELTASPESPRETVVVLHGAKLTRQDLLRLHHVTQAAVRQAGCGTVSFGVGETREGRDSGLKRLNAAYRESRQALKARPLHANGVVLHACDGGAGAANGGAGYPQERENALLLALQTANPEAVQREFERLYAAFEASAVSIGQLQQHALLLLHALDKQLHSQGSDWEQTGGRPRKAYDETIEQRTDCASIRRMFEDELIPLLLAVYGRFSEKSGEKLIAEIKNQIDAHPEQPFTLHELAVQHDRNPDYLSRIFKRMTGKTFVDYLTDVRIGNAKELLLRSRYKNYEIAERVGYEDYRYFSQIFKRKTGMTIGEYRRMHGLADQ